MTRTPMNAEPFILRKATSYLRQAKPNDTGWGAGPRSTMCRAGDPFIGMLER
ncbi:hypothetical protein [Mesorhizobium escarrei]|uniref:hypothetical protein n=1 Tax=Mesorhizobium escarrei TaxID=666018 RepID=UPI0020A78793|nr:hypothetical protein [Mesorhizobium escarrei]